MVAVKLRGLVDRRREQGRVLRNALHDILVPDRPVHVYIIRTRLAAAGLDHVLAAGPGPVLIRQDGEVSDDAFTLAAAQATSETLRTLYAALDPATMYV